MKFYVRRNGKSIWEGTWQNHLSLSQLDFFCVKKFKIFKALNVHDCRFCYSWLIIMHSILLHKTDRRYKMEKRIYGIIFFSRKPRYNKLQLRINTTSNSLKQIRKCNNATVFSFSSIYPAPTCNQGYVEGYSKWW